MTKNAIRPTSGEFLFAIFWASIVAVLAAIAGFVLAIFFCAKLLFGEMSEWALILAPATALFFCATAFAIVFRWALHYGDPSVSKK